MATTPPSGICSRLRRSATVCPPPFQASSTRPACITPPHPCAPLTIKPSPTTRPREGSVLAQPPADKAAADAENFRKARRLNAFMPGSSALQRGEPGRQLLDLRVGIALGDLVHYGGRALAVAEVAQLRRQ